MKKNEYAEKLRLENRIHISNLLMLIKTLNFKIEKLKHSKSITDNISKKFDIECYNYNLVYEMNESKIKFIKDLEELIKQIQKITARKSRNVDYDIHKLQSINDLLYSYEVQLNTINKNDLSDIEKLQLNAIKKEIYEKYMRKKGEIDRAILKEKFDKIGNRNFILKALDRFFVRTEIIDKQRENVFVAIKGIDDCIASFKEKSEPKMEYKILDITADIEIYLNENKGNRKKYREQYKSIIEIKDKIYSTFSIEKKELKQAISDKYKSKYPMPLYTNMNKMKSKYKKTIEFLYKSGYIKSHIETKYKSKMDILIKKLKLLSENVEREINR